MGEGRGRGRRCAQYIRMSTEHQRYSPAHQQATISAYAAERGHEIVAAYTDEGVSGVSIRGRAGLQKLLADVVGGCADFDTILVYDVSRWGRFQNPDQSAHYEFICAEAGVRIEYCAESFDNDGSLSSTLLKSLKRVMAAEYSRDLSAKIASAQARLAGQGYWQGGPPGYGLRRRMLGPDGRLGPILQTGQYKGIQGHRTILVPGPPFEVLTVNRIYRLYAYCGMTQRGVARLLNAEGVKADGGKLWTALRVHGVLTNRKYVGDLEFLKSASQLGERRWRTKPSDWQIAAGAFKPIVSRKLFQAAGQAMAQRQVLLSTEEMLAALRRLKETHGKITRKLINETPGLPNGQAFIDRFGSMAKACEAIGWPRADVPKLSRMPLPEDLILARLAALYAKHGFLSGELINLDPGLPSAHTIARRFGGLQEAYFRVGFDCMSEAELASPVGRARLVTAAFRRRELAARGTPRELT